MNKQTTISMLKLNPISLFRRFLNTSYFHPSTTSLVSNYINSHLDYFLSHQILPLQTLFSSHAFIVVSGNNNNVFIASKLISLYSSLFRPELATKVFESVHCKDTFLWNSIIKSHFSCGSYQKALEFFLGMRYSNTPPNDFTIPMVVTVCAELLAFNCGIMIHGLAIKLGIFGGNSAIGSSLVYFYSKCSCMRDADMVFDEMLVRDVVSWTALMIGYLQNGDSHKSLECLFVMHNTGDDCERPNYRTLLGGLQACGNIGALTEGKCLHCLALKNGYAFFHDVQSSLLSMYSKLGTLGDSLCLFNELGHKDLMCWTSIIAAYARMGCVTQCLGLFWQMQDTGICPDEIVISCVLSSFSDLKLVHEGKAFHGLIMRRNYVMDQVILRALMSMYSRFEMLDTTERIFDTLQEKSSETWNLMVFEYGKGGIWENCKSCFRNMIHQGIKCDTNSLVSVISSCLQLGTIRHGKSVHCYVIKSLLDNVSISNSLIDMYGKCGNLTVANTVFGRVQGDTVTWNTLICAYVYKGELAQALTLFDQMIFEGIRPSSATLVTVLSACSRLASLEKGMETHYYMREMGFDLNISLATALVDMYGKCGQLGKAREIFDSMIERDVIAWNVMISCYGIHGDAKSGIEVFNLMEKSSVRPNELTFLAVLLACSHAGLTEEGRYFFHKMQDDYSLIPTLKHYACIVDLLGKSGNLQEAEGIVMSMPITPDGGLWGTLLSACKIHNEVEIGLRIIKHAIKADPQNDGYYITISNMLESTGNWEEAEKFRQLMKTKGVSKKLGWSSS